MQLQKDNKMVFWQNPTAICPNWQQSKFSLENYQVFNLLERRNWDAMHSRHSSNCPLNCWDARPMHTLLTVVCRPNSCSETVLMKNQSVDKLAVIAIALWSNWRVDARSFLEWKRILYFVKEIFFCNIFLLLETSGNSPSVLRANDPFFDCSRNIAFWRSSSCTHATKKYS